MTITSPFTNRNIIGYVSEVTPYNLRIHFPDSTVLKRFNHFGDSLHGGKLGGYVAIEGETKGFIGKIVKLSLPEKERIGLSEKTYKSKEFHPVGIVEILYSFDLLSFNPQRSIQDYPPISSKVYACSSELYIEILDRKKDEPTNDSIELGNALGSTEIVNLSANNLFERHCAILGTTGGGKSYSLARIIEQITGKDDAKIILLDATGEFAEFDEEEYTEKAVFNDDNDSCYFDYRNFIFNDLIALFRPSGQSQLPLLEHSLKILSSMNELEKVFTESSNYLEEGNSKAFKKAKRKKKDFNKIVGVAQISDYSIESLPNQLYLSAVHDNDFNTTDGKTFGDIDKNANGYLQSLISRIKTILLDKECMKIFDFGRNNTKDNDLVNKLEDFYAKDKKLFRIDLSNIPETGDIKGVLVNAIGRYFLDKSKEKNGNKKFFEEKPIIIFIDEAHLFLNKKIKDEYSIEVELNAFDRIAKECRKFGVFLCLSTQRPRDIPEGVLSQIGTFIVHRLINEKDKQSVENASPSYSKEFLSFLPSLGEGEAIIMGVNFLTTLFVKIKKPLIKPKSNTPKLFNN